MRSLDCNEVVELVTEFLDGALRADERDSVVAHLEQCDGCGAYLAQVRATVLALGQVQDPPIDEQFRNRLLAAFRESTP